MAEITLSQAEFDAFRLFLEQSCGISLGDNKQYLLTSRLRGLLKESGVASIRELLEKMSREPRSGLRERVVDAMTTNETLWFRDQYPFETLKRVILPDLAKRKKGPLRIWSAACSSGQEPYSISMIVQEYRREYPRGLLPDVRIVATDISPSMLKLAREGAYDNFSLGRGLTGDRLERFFIQQGDRRVVKEEVRRSVTFREVNLMHSFSALGKFDVIFCRNVLIYFSASLKTDILARFAQSLESGGYLILGGSESVTDSTGIFEAVRAGRGMLYRHKISS